MTWIDIALIVLLLVFMGAGARLGSLWTGACLVGGFLAMMLADTYALPLAGFMGPVPGAHLIAAVALYAAGLAVALVPGWLLTRVTSALFLGLVNAVFGLFTGAFAGCLAAGLLLLFLVPAVPRLQKEDAWKKSVLARPLEETLEATFNKPVFRPSDVRKRVAKEGRRAVAPVTKKAREAFDDLKERAGDAVRP